MTNRPFETMRKFPRQSRARRTVDIIFEATAQILRRDGEKSLNTNRIAEVAGFSIGTLYQYFPNMDAILLAMIDAERNRVIARQEAIIAEAESSDADPQTLIRIYIRSLVDAFGVAAHLHRPLLKRAWCLDHMPSVIAATQAMTERIRLGFVRRAHPDYPPPDQAVLFVATRAVLGAIRSAVHEDSPLLGSAAFEDALVAMVIGLLFSGRTPERDSIYATP